MKTVFNYPHLQNCIWKSYTYQQSLFTSHIHRAVIDCVTAPIYTVWYLHLLVLTEISQPPATSESLWKILHLKCFVFSQIVMFVQAYSVTYKILQHIWSQGPRNMSAVCLHWCMTTCTGWLFPSECSTSLLWQSIVVFSTDLQVTSPNIVCQSLKFLVTSICDLPDVINC